MLCHNLQATCLRLMTSLIFSKKGLENNMPEDHTLPDVTSACLFYIADHTLPDVTSACLFYIADCLIMSAMIDWLRYFNLQNYLLCKNNDSFIFTITTTKLKTTKLKTTKLKPTSTHHRFVMSCWGIMVNPK